jgi:hypothetical protein
LEVIRWTTPWPLVQVSDVEWVILRDDPAHPAALVREIPNRPNRYRVVRWAPRSEDRRLFEYFPSLELADMAVTFVGREPDAGITRLSTERSPEWARFERWFWSQCSERIQLEMRPPWLTMDLIALTRNPPRPAR